MGREKVTSVVGVEEKADKDIKTKRKKNLL